MCTYIIRSDPEGEIPLLIAMTRDMNPKRTIEPASLWDKPELFSETKTIHLECLKHGVDRYVEAEIVAPKDMLGGTYMAQNRHGVVAAINNRRNDVFESRNELPVKRNGDFLPRGGLPLDACSFKTAEEAKNSLWEAIVKTQRGAGKRYSAFNMLIADAKDVWVITNALYGDIMVGQDRFEYEDAGKFSLALWKAPAVTTSMLAGFDLNDFARSERTKKYLPELSKLPLPKIGHFSSWHPWLNLMAYRNEYRNKPFCESICQPDPVHFGGVGDSRSVTVGANFMLVGRNTSSWYGIEGQLVGGKILEVQEIGQENTNNYFSMRLGENGITTLAGASSSMWRG